MKQYFSELYTGGKSLVEGLGVTMKALFMPIVTVQYPREEIDISPSFRGHIDLILDPEKNSYRCITCGMCEKSCPSDCITVKGEKREGEKKKTLVLFELDFTKCSLCGTCVEVCPVNALEYSKEYNLAAFSREAFHYDILKRLEERIK
ncbi:MAG: NADH-quinone oxidoreductase subunit I [Desulfobacterales bacterium]|jgi:NADH-quinone oxidoreductase subunit I